MLGLAAFSFWPMAAAEPRVREDTEEPPDAGRGLSEATDLLAAIVVVPPIGLAVRTDDDEGAAAATLLAPPPPPTLLPVGTAFPPFPFALTAIGS